MRPHRHGPFPVHPRPPAGDGGFASQPPAPPPRAAPVGAGDGPGHIPTRSFLPALRSPPVPESRSPSPGWMSRPTPSLPAAPQPGWPAGPGNGTPPRATGRPCPPATGGTNRPDSGRARPPPGCGPRTTTPVGLPPRARGSGACSTRLQSARVPGRPPAPPSGLR